LNMHGARAKQLQLERPIEVSSLSCAIQFATNQ
jgi:hypothetical protein